MGEYCADVFAHVQPSKAVHPISKTIRIVTMVPVRGIPLSTSSFYPNVGDMKME